MRTFGKMVRFIQLNRLLFNKSSFKIYLRLKSNSPKTEKPSSKSKRYSNTLNLPQTSFALTMKSGASAKRELEMQKTSGFQSLYQWQYDQNWNKEFILHDGPPYANGKTHVGHVVNKVLKDIMNRYKVLKKYKVHYVPGWDCHGMPIETKAITDKSGRHIELPALDIRTKAKKYAENVLEEQKQSFKRWGVMGDWNNAYRTLAPSYEAKQLEVFYRIYEKGYIYRDYMPVYWSPSSCSALAEAELEYKHDHVSKSVYVKFPIHNRMGLDFALFGACNYPLVYVLVWTTTPWTIPFNKAICYNSKLEYMLVRDRVTGEFYFCETSFFEKLKLMVPGGLDYEMSFTGDIFKGMTYLNPIDPMDGEELTFLHSDHVTSGKGTGLVHIAPAHGHDDFSIAIEHNLPRECFVDERGTYTSEVDGLLRGKTVGVDADDAVISALGSHVLKVEDFTHSYPYDWRTKQPIIIRASKQWFIDVKALRSQALESLSQVKITPQNSENGMIAELNSRPYWCISRQRKWGVPMPIFYKISGEPLITRETVEHIINLIRKHGSDCWWNLPMEDLLPNNLLEKLELGNNVDYKKGEDILDIWFDSGVSWAAVLGDYGGQADVYLEGIDQFKGWFQTSLLTSVAVNGKAPYKQLITHGFATDEKGKKMSKSEGNIIDPEEVISGGMDKNSSPSYGADILRWWVAHSHHHQNIMIGPAILQQFQEDVFKLRKCIRHLLGNLYDFKPNSDIVPYSRLTPVDTYMLYVLYTTIKEIEAAYEEFSYQRIIQHLEKFFYSDLSAFYITNTKDRCYCDVAAGESRRSSQTVQYFIVKLMSSAFAPIIPHLAEEIYRHMPDCDVQNPDSDSIFKLGWCHPHSEWNNPKAASNLLPVFDMRRSVLDALALESPVDFDILIYSSPQLHDLLREIQPEVTSSTSSLCEIFQTSQVSVLDSPPLVIPEDSLIVQGSTRLLGDGSSQEDTEVDYKILVASSLLHICERCRRYTSKSPSTPCDRCLQAVAHDWST